MSYCSAKISRSTFFVLKMLSAAQTSLQNSGHFCRHVSLARTIFVVSDLLASALSQSSKYKNLQKIIFIINIWISVYTYNNIDCQ
ncbi:hypothetical protein NTGM5_290064 [Candidatus Nitrotoga sp. M5]|nr:hypothetical protein NTGM5_290064 [Candidatus Nitrotoga sp. M5]